MQGLPREIKKAKSALKASLESVSRFVDLGVVWYRCYPCVIEERTFQNRILELLAFSEQREAANFCSRGFGGYK